MMHGSMSSLPLLPGNSAKQTSIMKPLPKDNVWRHSASGGQKHTVDKNELAQLERILKRLAVK